MPKRFAVLAAAAALTACQTMGELLTVKDYTAKSGERVVAGQAVPKSEYGCQKLSTEKQDWGVSGNMDRVAAQERVTRVAVDTAPSKGANYVNVMPPASTSLGSINVNAFADARVEYYRCANLPPAK
jgi:hypothetical protein